MKTYRNEGNEEVSLVYATRAEHFEEGHVCQGNCSDHLVKVPPGSLVTLDESQENWPDIEALIALSSLEEVEDPDG